MTTNVGVSSSIDDGIASEMRAVEKQMLVPHVPHNPMRALILTLRIKPHLMCIVFRQGLITIRNNGNHGESNILATL